MLDKTGVPTIEDIMDITPPKGRRERGPVAVIECFQKIPCNPCYTACSFGAIEEFEDINDRPKIDYDKCTGCGLCLTKCPGLAIFIVDESYSEKEALVKIPYEFLPLPEEGSVVTGLNREGRAVCKAKIKQIQKMKNKTNVVTLIVPKERSMDVRGFSMVEYNDENTIICRCEGITLGQVRKLIKEGYRTVDEIKRITRAGMGPCQGRTCRQLIMQEIAKSTEQRIENMSMPTFRPPTMPIKLGAIAGGESDE